MALLPRQPASQGKNRQPALLPMTTGGSDWLVDEPQINRTEGVAVSAKLQHLAESALLTEGAPGQEAGALVFTLADARSLADLKRHNS